MPTVRRLEKADLAMVRIRGEGIAAALFPEMIPDIAKEHETLRQLCADPKHYVGAIGDTGDPEAVLVARTGDNLWATKQHATILLWYSHKPGSSIALLRDFRNWVRTQKHIALAGFMDDFGLDLRMRPLLQRVGFRRRGGAYVYFPPRGAKR